MPPVAFSSFDQVLLGGGGSGSASHADCTSMDRDELVDCFKQHEVRVLIAQPLSSYSQLIPQA